MTPAADTAGWLTAAGTIFAAVGTIGAVIVALWQTKRRDEYKVHVTCNYGITGDDAIGSLVVLQATNTGERLVKLTGAYLETEGVSRGSVVAKFFQPGPEINLLTSLETGPLPKSLVDGESITVHWRLSTLEEIKEREGFDRYVAAYFTDPLGNMHSAPYPGMELRRTGLFRKRREYAPTTP